MCDEQSIRDLERKIPKLAKSATRQAYEQAIAKGSSVVTAAGGKLIKVSADGSYEVIKNISSPVKVELGRKIRLCS